MVSILSRLRPPQLTFLMTSLTAKSNSLLNWVCLFVWVWVCSCEEQWISSANVSVILGTSDTSRTLWPFCSYQCYYLSLTLHHHSGWDTWRGGGAISWNIEVETIDECARNSHWKTWTLAKSMQILGEVQNRALTLQSHLIPWPILCTSGLIFSYKTLILLQITWQKWKSPR